jgi:hypothetical protein
VYKSRRERRYLAATRQRLVIIEPDGNEGPSFPFLGLREFEVKNGGVILLFGDAGVGWRVKQPGPRFIDLAALAWVVSSDHHDEVVHLGALSSMHARRERSATYLEALAEFFSEVANAVGASRRM